MEQHGELRKLEKSWDYSLVVACLVVSMLGTFTSTQLMIQARLSTRFTVVLAWIVIISLTFGFCAIFSLHLVGMLACQLDLPIGLDIGMTFLSAVPAVVFTFAALGFDMLRTCYYNVRKPARLSYGEEAPMPPRINRLSQESSLPLLGGDNREETLVNAGVDDDAAPNYIRKFTSMEQNFSGEPNQSTESDSGFPFQGYRFGGQDPDGEAQDLASPMFMRENHSRIPPSQHGSSVSGPYDLENMAFQGVMPTKNAFVAIYEGFRAGLCWRAVLMGLIWSLAIFSMHYLGLAAMRIPGGYLSLSPILVFVSALISWVVCIIGYIYMANIEPHISQQLLFSFIAACGISGMHFTGMRATTFWSVDAPAEVRGYPPQLPVAVCSIAILTCTLANGLLAHNAILSRNKLAEIVWTRRKLWRALAQKENAEAAAAARSEFIALASHEIRTPLHHLQGYSDLLSRTDLSDEGRLLLSSIQSATKTLSLITNNVLDWSKLESDRDAIVRLSAVDMRAVFESILLLLPNQDNDSQVEILVVVAPDVPKSVSLDETYTHRILMNLLSNSLKFTMSGFVMLSLEIEGDNLIAKVIDTGSGIPQSFLPQLFDPFSQAQTRGTQRGTGLGLSIVQKLLGKMDGTVTVKTQHAEQGFDPDETGTTFTVSIPIQETSPPALDPASMMEIGKIALFRFGNPRYVEGLKLAWELFGYEVILVDSFAELASKEVKYVWSDSNFLQHNPDCLQQLRNQQHWTVFVQFDSQQSLQRLPGLVLGPPFVPLPKPLVWHTFASRIAVASHASSRLGSSKTLRFSSQDPAVKVTTHIRSNSSGTTNNETVLLVEDNPINQKLGQKMLTSLGYSVLLASDGDIAITQIIKHDTSISMILMDQSMPMKDGVTATREIRALEAEGKLSRRHPIIAVTAVVDLQSRSEFRAAGADDFLAKPLSMTKLEKTLATFLL